MGVTPVSEFTIRLEQVEDYQFRVRFDKEPLPDLFLDEPPPLGKDRGPSPVRVLAAAIGDCLSASLIFCARKARIEPGKIQTQVRVQIVRNESGRLRVGKVTVTIDPGVAESDREKLRRCLEVFEDYCTVTQSVRQGLDVEVRVTGFEDEQG